MVHNLSNHKEEKLDKLKTLKLIDELHIVRHPHQKMVLVE